MPRLPFVRGTFGWLYLLAQCAVLVVVNTHPPVSIAGKKAMSSFNRLDMNVCSSANDCDRAMFCDPARYVCRFQAALHEVCDPNIKDMCSKGTACKLYAGKRHTLQPVYPVYRCCIFEQNASETSHLDAAAQAETNAIFPEKDSSSVQTTGKKTTLKEEFSHAWVGSTETKPSDPEPTREANDTIKEPQIDYDNILDKLSTLMARVRNLRDRNAEKNSDNLDDKKLETAFGAVRDVPNADHGRWEKGRKKGAEQLQEDVSSVREWVKNTASISEKDSSSENSLYSELLSEETHDSPPDYAGKLPDLTGDNKEDVPTEDITNATDVCHRVEELLQYLKTLTDKRAREHVTYVIVKCVMSPPAMESLAVTEVVPLVLGNRAQRVSQAKDNQSEKVKTHVEGMIAKREQTIGILKREQVLEKQLLDLLLSKHAEKAST